MTMACENYRYIDYLVGLLTFCNRIPSHLCNVFISGPFVSIHDQSFGDVSFFMRRGGLQIFISVYRIFFDPPPFWIP